MSAVPKPPCHSSPQVFYLATASTMPTCWKNLARLSHHTMPSAKPFLGTRRESPSQLGTLQTIWPRLSPKLITYYFSPQILYHNKANQVSTHEHLCTEPSLTPSPALWGEGGAPKLYPASKAYHPRSCPTHPSRATPALEPAPRPHLSTSSCTNARLPMF